jgi:hypothetical protein
MVTNHRKKSFTTEAITEVPHEPTTDPNRGVRSATDGRLRKLGFTRLAKEYFASGHCAGCT